MTMTSRERIANILARKPVDRIGLYEHFWGDTLSKWTKEGHLPPLTNVEDHFGFDLQLQWPFNFMAHLGVEPEILDETDETILARDGNGAVLRRSKTHDATPEHVDFLVKDRAGWDQHIKPHLAPDRRRIDFEGYRRVRREAAEKGRFFCWCGTGAFELMHPVCGHQYMLMGMAMDPDWVKDMAATFAQRTIELMEILFSEEGWPDGLWLYEDMGFKERPFFSLEMYRDIIQPAHKAVIQFAKARRLPVIMHSCGFVAPLVPGMIEAGIDCLQVIEAKAGMDLCALYRDFGDRLSFMGGMDVRTLYSNDRSAIERELSQKIPRVKGRFGYCLHSDHSIPNQVEYQSYRYFVERGLELGGYS